MRWKWLTLALLGAIASILNFISGDQVVAVVLLACALVCYAADEILEAIG